jgi:hypothetical protein
VWANHRINGPTHQSFIAANLSITIRWRMDGLTAFGLFAVTAMLVCYALEQRSPWFILAFAGACGLGSTYGFLQGAWPFGLVEAVWALVALRRWHHGRYRSGFRRVR